jgi:hypothetical protein
MSAASNVYVLKSDHGLRGERFRLEGPAKKVPFSPAQLRGARSILNWSRSDLAEASGVPMATLAFYECGRTKSMLSEAMGKIIAAFEKEGVIFIVQDKTAGAGVRFKKASAE